LKASRCDKPPVRVEPHPTWLRLPFSEKVGA
jgi:hypothetical protein